METDQHNLQPPSSNEDKTSQAVAFLIMAFLPALAGIGCLNFKNPAQWMFPLLLLLNLVCSVVASIGLVRGMKNEGIRFAVGFFLIPIFFVLNVFIVLFIGCSGGGRIAP